MSAAELRLVEPRRRARQLERSTSPASSSSDATGRTASAEPDEDGERRHGQRLEPVLAQRAERRGARGASTAPRRSPSSAGCDGRRRAPSAAQRLEELDLHAVLVTWSSPRMTWVIAEVDVVDHRGQRVEIVPSSRTSTGSDSEAQSTWLGPRTRSSQATMRCSSRKRQCGRRPSASSAARSSAVSASAARS